MGRGQGRRHCGAASAWRTVSSVAAASAWYCSVSLAQTLTAHSVRSIGDKRGLAAVRKSRSGARMPEMKKEGWLGSCLPVMR